ncbi:MAG: phosphoribosylglycinamide formyltransferase [Eubacteriales bacterium]|jgi:phosphoribosylglycinamide formyltransferase-1|nr:phosphoribosylglycinamide formyltransferase [Clostridiales bacterium]MDY5732709.1 phosphoribosylglycinamide formyltransferase [Eubacteriales bacterium]
MLSVNVAVLVSGGGTNLQALIDAQKRGELGRGEIKLVISNRKNAYALQRAENNGIETAYVKMRRGDSACENELLELLQKKGIDMLVLAGYLAILGENIINAYRNRIINIHPSLIPSFCGMGYYGLKVHEAALEYGVKVTGATVHYVNEIADGGKIILQKAVDVREDDTPETLQLRVMQEAEWKLLPQATKLVCERIYSERNAL